MRIIIGSVCLNCQANMLIQQLIKFEMIRLLLVKLKPSPVYFLHHLSWEKRHKTLLAAEGEKNVRAFLLNQIYEPH